MTKTLLIEVLLTSISDWALAGPNAGGTIFVHNPQLSYPVPAESACGLGIVPSTCENANTEIDGSDNTAVVWKVYAAFPACSRPRLKAIAWGIHYPPYNPNGGLSMWVHGACEGYINIPADWPGSGW